MPSSESTLAVPAEKTKKCRGPCALSKGLSAFRLVRPSNRPNPYRKAWCKECEQDRNDERRYGLEPGVRRSMYEAQGGKCKICSRKCPRASMLAVDHDHATGRVRGLLCSDCNLGLGHFEDSMERLTRAVLYLLDAQSSTKE